MKNIHSSDSVAEDLIRSFVQIGCTELHTKTLIEKKVSELEQGISKNEEETLKEIDYLREELENQSTIRRKSMLKLFNMFNGDKDYWCEVKHLGMGAYCMFEAYQGSDEDGELYMLALESNKLFIKALSKFLGKEITECAACFGDMMKGEK